MEQIKWTTTSVWFDETLELFNEISDEDNVESISKKINSGIIFGDMKEATAKRVWGTIRARYFISKEDKAKAIKKVLCSLISKQEKLNHAFIYFIECENIYKIFLEQYVFQRFTQFNQKIFTQMDLDKFMEYITVTRNVELPAKLQLEITDSSMKKVRNMLYKNIEAFGWGNVENGRLIIRRPSLTPEWFCFLLYFYYDESIISKSDLINSGILKRFLLNEYDIEYLLTASKMKGYAEVSQLGDISNITLDKEGIFEYAETYR